METPSSGPLAPPEESSRPESPPERGDREVLAFLEKSLLPALTDRAPRPLREAIRRALREHRLVPLERLSGRHRHELLLALEQVSHTRRRPSPAVCVRLTTVVSSTPAPSELVEISAVRPAR
jgi:hypothetical protein